MLQVVQYTIYRIRNQFQISAGIEYTTHRIHRCYIHTVIVYYIESNSKQERTSCHLFCKQIFCLPLFFVGGIFLSSDDSFYYYFFFHKRTDIMMDDFAADPSFYCVFLQKSRPWCKCIQRIIQRLCCHVLLFYFLLANKSNREIYPQRTQTTAHTVDVCVWREKAGAAMEKKERRRKRTVIYRDDVIS